MQLEACKKDYIIIFLTLPVDKSKHTLGNKSHPEKSN